MEAAAVGRCRAEGYIRKMARTRTMAATHTCKGVGSCMTGPERTTGLGSCMSKGAGVASRNKMAQSYKKRTSCSRRSCRGIALKLSVDKKLLNLKYRIFGKYSYVFNISKLSKRKWNFRQSV